MKRAGLILLTILTLDACGTSAEPDFYIMSEISGTVYPEAAAVVKVRRPVLAAYLDRPDFVRETGDRIQIDEMARWTEPIDRMFARVLAEDLQQRLPAGRIMTEDTIPSEKAGFVVNIDLQTFNSVQSGHAALKGSFIVTDTRFRGPARQPLAPRPVALAVYTGSSPQSVAAGLSSVTAQLADQIALLLADQTNASSPAD
jgi:uncharacterized lipoprotein YmbA